MNIERKFDVVVIGSGPGGEGAAMQSIKKGLKTCIIEEATKLGGNCTHFGTIPSKTIRHIAHRLTSFKNDPLFHNYLNHNAKSLRFSDIVNHSNHVINQQVDRRSSHYQRNNVSVLYGKAQLIDKNTIVIINSEGEQYIQGDVIILAMGSKPFHPQGIDFNHPRIFDSDSILTLSFEPKIVTVYGAGVIGCEYTSIFRLLEKKVNLINSKDKLLNFLDTEIIDALSYHLRDQGVIIRNQETVAQVEANKDYIITELQSGKIIKSDILLVATGRRGNTNNIGLEKIGVELTKTANIVVNQHYQTSVKNIYAVGDLSGFPALASSAYDQGRFAACHVVNNNCDDSLVRDIPLGIYTSPEISCIGKTEAQLTQEKIPYEVGHVSFRHLARAQITSQTVGMLKLLFHTKTLEILGIHCFGQSAAEIIHIGQAVMAQESKINNLNYFINTTFNYPTMAEAYRVAALNGYNRLLETDATNLTKNI